MRTGVLTQKVAYYLKMRMYMCIYMIVVGILVGLVYLFVLRKYVIDNRTRNPRTDRIYTEEEATAFGVSAFIGVLLPLLINVAVLYGYKQSFDDSTTMLGGSSALGQTGAVNGGVIYRPGPFGGGALGPAPPPMHTYQGAPPMTIGGTDPSQQAFGVARPNPSAPGPAPPVPYNPQIGQGNPMNNLAPLPPGFGESQTQPGSLRGNAQGFK